MQSGHSAAVGGLFLLLQNVFEALLLTSANLNWPIPAKFVPFKGGGTALQFDVPNNILHPIAGLTVAVRSVESTLKKGFLTSVGYKGAKRPVAVTFLTEDGQTSRVGTTA